MKSSWVIAILLIFILVACVSTSVRHLKILTDEVDSTFKSRNELMAKFVALQHDRVAVMANILLNEYQSHPLPPTPPLDVQQHPEQEVWQLIPAKPVVGNLTGIGQLPLTPAVEREIHAVLAMDAQIKPALELDKDVVWVYFLSVNNFIYLAPTTAVDSFHFTPALYDGDHWLEAGPAVNKERRLVISKLYEDTAGRGWIVTFVQPVYADEQFLGIVALDLNLDIFAQLTNIGTATGESWLLSEHGRVIARQHGFQPGLIIQPPLSDESGDWQQDANGDMWLSNLVVEDELWLVHHLQRSELYWAVARESTGVWILAMILGLLAFMSLRLHKTLGEVTRLTRVDLLTQVLNRRGFYEASARAIAIAKRKKLVLGVLLLDIDYFKKINDNYGHAEGDSVLGQVGGFLNSACRPSDICCRWGGEEFLILLSLDRAEDAMAIAERMRAQAQRSKIQTDATHITLSGGLIFMGANESLDDAIKRADELLYQSKHAGRNQITCEKD